MNRLRLFTFCLGTLLAQPLLAEERSSQLSALIQDALTRNPDVAAARERIQAERQRAPQASSLPDPMVSLGYQNDGFTSLPLGTMPTTYFTLMATQPLPYPGKRQAREQAAAAGVDVARARVDRLLRTLEADVARGYVGLLLARGQLRLLQAQEALWQRAEALARTRYEVGQGSQTDVLRAQLQRTRLRQTRAGLEAEAQGRRIELNRLAVRPLEAPLATAERLEDLPLPAVLPDAVTQALAESPDLAITAASVAQVGKRISLAQIEAKPDFSVTAGLMPRGKLEPMWLLSVGGNLPIHSGTRQDHAVAEGKHLRAAEEQAAESVRQLVAWRTRDRMVQLRAVLETCRLYKGLLAQSEATLKSSLTQYGVGRLPFAAVLDALGGQLADENGYLAVLAQAQALAIALREIDLGPTRAIGSGGAMASASLPGAGASMPSSGASSMSAPAGSPDTGASPSM